jgi:hypothetical protein
MADGHGRDAWGRVSLLCALIANAHRDPKRGRALQPADFDPYARTPADEVIEVNGETIGLLKQAFTNQQGG